jgi:hypothetical protein
MGKHCVPVLLAVSFLGYGCATRDVAMEHYKRGQYDQAIRVWARDANAGEAIAQYNLGLMWEHGQHPLHRDPRQAAAWYVRAAKQGHVESMVRLADVQKQLGYASAAASWATLAARWGDENAQRLLSTWGLRVPVADLKLQQQQRKAANDAAGALMLLGTMDGASSSSARSRQSFPVPAATLDSAARTPSAGFSQSGAGQRGSTYPYRGASGTQYQYDLSRPGDQLRYEFDPRAQQRDETSVDPRRSIDSGFGQQGGGIRR